MLAGGLRIVEPHGGALVEKLPDDLDRRGLADVVGLGLEGQAQDGDPLVLEDPEGLADLVHEQPRPARR